MITVLHISDTQFGKEHRFGSKEPFDTLYQRLEDDLRGLKKRHGLKPDLVAVTGDLAEWGMGHELEVAFDFLKRLSNHLELTHDRIAIIPGNHDVNRKFCRGYFEDCGGDGKEPAPPFWRKWKPWEEKFREFYDEHEGICFTEGEPWTLYRMAELKVAVAGLNSTIAESHLDKDHYGYLGEQQLRWFAKELKSYRDNGWFRIGLVHHNPIRGAVDDSENLRDYDDLKRILGPFLNVVLHGHTHNGKIDFMDQNIPIVSTGSAGLRPGALPSDVPNQYQILRFSRSRLQQYTRYFVPGQKRWIGDTRFSDSGDDWNISRSVDFQDTEDTFSKIDQIRHVANFSRRATPSWGQSEGFDDVDLVLQAAHRWEAEELIVEYRFHSPSGVALLDGEVTCHQSISAPISFRRDLFREFEKIHSGRNIRNHALVSEEVPATLEEIGCRLYDRLFPQAAKDVYRHARDVVKTLLVVSDDPWIPWELLKPFDDRGDDFFCLRFEMSRWLSGAPPAVAVKNVKSFVCLAAEEIPDCHVLDEATEEVRLVEESISDVPGVEGRVIKDPLHVDVMRTLSSGLDLFHYVGHGEDSDVGTDVAWIGLADRPFCVRQIFGPLARRLQQYRPVVFMNSGGWSDLGLGGWAEGWIERGGASIFLAPYWAVRDSSARIFATAFYRELRAKRRLGDSVRIARREVQAKDPTDISWLAYRVYGNPNTRVLFGEDVPE